MLLDGEFLEKFKPDIEGILLEHFGASIDEVTNHFGIVQDTQLQAIGSLGCNGDGDWYLCCGYVKPMFRGNGLQKKLIQERVQYIEGLTDTLRAAIHPDNAFSIANIVAQGFEYECVGRLEATGELVSLYKIDL